MEHRKRAALSVTPPSKRRGGCHRKRRYRTGPSRRSRRAHRTGDTHTDIPGLRIYRYDDAGRAGALRLATQAGVAMCGIVGVVGVVGGVA